MVWYDFLCLVRSQIWNYVAVYWDVETEFYYLIPCNIIWNFTDNKIFYTFQRLCTRVYPKVPGECL